MVPQSVSEFLSRAITEAEVSASVSVLFSDSTAWYWVGLLEIHVKSRGSITTLIVCELSTGKIDQIDVRNERACYFITEIRISGSGESFSYKEQVERLSGLPFRSSSSQYRFRDGSMRTNISGEWQKVHRIKHEQDRLLISRLLEC